MPRYALSFASTELEAKPVGDRVSCQLEMSEAVTLQKPLPGAPHRGEGQDELTVWDRLALVSVQLSARLFRPIRPGSHNSSISDVPQSLRDRRPSPSSAGRRSWHALVDYIKLLRQTNSPVDVTLRHALRSKMGVIRASSEQIMLICFDKLGRE